MLKSAAVFLQLCVLMTRYSPSMKFTHKNNYLNERRFHETPAPSRVQFIKFRRLMGIIFLASSERQLIIYG